MSTTEQNKLARLVKRFLDVVWVLLIFTAIIWPIAVLVIGLSMPSDPLERHADIDAFLGFKINSELLRWAKLVDVPDSILNCS